MDEYIGTSPQSYGVAAVPELSGCEPAALGSLPSLHTPATPPQPPVILVVDDEPNVGHILRRLLPDLLPDRSPKYDILIATDPSAALRHIAQRTVALVITDFNLPKMSGIQLAARVKLRAPHTPVLLMTGYPTPILARLVQQRDIQYYLAKPFRLAELERVIVAALTTYDAPTH
jgi:CheY-like chemotaxis protein